MCKCIRCGKNTGCFTLCNSCISKIDNEVLQQNITRCKNCGKLLVSEQDLCTDCIENPIIKNIDKIIPIFSYRLWKKELLYKWKIEGYRNIAILLAKYIYWIYSKNFNNICFVPIPPRPKKIFSKGWDQINDIAKYLRIIYKCKINNLLIRTEKQQQKKLNRVERLAHIGTSYKFNKKQTNIPNSVVLIDDILTTGVTIETCAQILKEKGVKYVYAITLFIAD